MKKPLTIVGAGLYGLTVARVAAERGVDVHLIDKRAQVGGNSVSHIDPATGVEVHTYGSHIFHTSNREVWDYVRRFSDFTDYRHHVQANYFGHHYPLPFSLATLAPIIGAASPEEARRWIENDRPDLGREPENFEEQAIQLVGETLYWRLVEGYTRKQWGRDPRDLPASIIRRLPVRYTYDTRYFSDTWEGLPEVGYSEWTRRMADHEKISVTLGVDGKERALEEDAGPVVWTGPVDALHGRALGSLSWRTVELIEERLPVADAQGCAVMNYTGNDVPWTRIHEPHHFRPDRPKRSDETLIVKEFSRLAGPKDDPCYPVASAEDRRLLGTYRAVTARGFPWIHLGGRLGTYTYLDMHMAIASALSFMRNGFEEWYDLHA